MAALASRLPPPITVGRIFGVPLRLDWSWMPTIPVYCWAIAAVYLPNTAPGRPVLEYWALGLVTTLLLIVSVIAHELAHALVARAEGLEISDITLHLFGGMARLGGEPETPAAEFKIAVVGPGASFALGVFFLLLDTIFVTGTTYVAIGRVLRHLGLVNLVLATFNLLPGFPLDGGRVLKAYLWRRKGDPVAATRTARSAGRSIAWALIPVGIYVYLGSDRLTGLWSISIGTMLLLVLGLNERGMRESARSSHVLDRMRPAPARVTPQTTIHELINDVLPHHQQAAFLVTDGGRLHGILALADIRDIPKEEWRDHRVSRYLKLVEDSFFVLSTEPLHEVERKLSQNEFGVVAVLDGDGIVVGSIDHKDLSKR